MTTTSILRATCDKILAIAPAPEKEMEEVGGIIIPEAAIEKVKAAMKKNPMQVLEIASAGPDCKVARKGLRVIVNENHYHGTVEHEGVHYACFSEVTAFAILEAEEEKPKDAVLHVQAVGMSIAEIRTVLGLDQKPKDDRDALPVEAARD